ncbi:hypothetical protein Esti_003973 [Eimeria stiedai]
MCSSTSSTSSNRTLAAASREVDLRDEGAALRGSDLSIKAPRQQRLQQLQRRHQGQPQLLQNSCSNKGGSEKKRSFVAATTTQGGGKDAKRGGMLNCIIT